LIRIERQALLLSVEQFTVPEILFRPSDVEMKQIGLAEAIVQSIEACDPIYRPAMYHNIVLTGGNVKMPNFKERLETELRSIAPINYKIRIHLPRDPVAFAFEGAQDVVKADGFVGGLDRAEWEVLKQSGKVSDRWCSKKVDGDSSDGFIVI
jgi:actin-related protein